jgi:hypothetical protein
MTASHRPSLARAGRATAFAALVLVGSAFAAPRTVAQREEHFSLGSASSVVARVQGRPQLVERLASLGYERWTFDRSWVRIRNADDRVDAFANIDGALKVELRPGPDTTTDRAFGVGSSRSDVIRLQGTPQSYEPRPEAGAVLVRYGRATVRFGLDNGRVVSWDDPQHTLRVRDSRWDEPAAYPSPSAPPSRAPGGIPRPTAPAVLSATLTFEDDGRDGWLDAEERATITARVRNSGRGTAYDVALTGSVAGDARGVDLGRGDRVDSLAPGATATLRLPLSASSSLREGELVIVVGAREGNGFDLTPPARLRLKTRPLRAPRFVLGALAVRDQSGNGRIEPREIVDVTARVANQGSGDARQVRITIATGEGITLVGDPVRTIEVGPLRAGESRDVTFSAFSNSRATAFPVSLGVREARQRYDTTLVLPLALDRRLPNSTELVVRGRDSAATVAAPTLVPAVDTGIPRAPVRTNVIAVALGVERYERGPAAQFARHDAAVFRAYAQRTLGVGDDPARLYARSDDEVTSAELHKLFDADGWLARRVTAETDLVIYFAGHGATDPKTRTSYILPNDADPNYPAQTGFALTVLYERLATLHARSVTVFIDACFSGLSRSGEQLQPGARGVVVSVEHPALRQPGMAVFTAAGAAQIANAWPAQQHGVFTYWLLAGLRGGADADRDGAVSVAELSRFLTTNVPRTAASIDREQSPTIVTRDSTRALVRFK